MRDPGGGGPPSYLDVGDRIAVVAPSGPVDRVRLERGCAVLRDLGFEVEVGEHVLDRDDADGPGTPGLGYLAGSDAGRAADLQRAWCDPAIAAVMCARGGYGAARVLDRLDWTALSRARPKLLHGSSDITALHAAFGRRLSVPTSFGPMVAALVAGAGARAGATAGANAGTDRDTDAGTDRDTDPGTVADTEPGAEAVAHLRSSVTGGAAPVTGGHALRGGRVTGPLTGGNLSLLTSLLGTPYAPEPAAGRIVLLEDVNEAPYRVDRMLTQLLQAGWFDGVAGVALGTWVGCGPAGAVEAVLAERLTPLGVPILGGLPVGHGPRQLTVRLGAPAVLDADALVLHPDVPDARVRHTGPATAPAGEAS